MLSRLSRIFLLKRASKETFLSIALVVAALTSMAAFAHGIMARTEKLGRADTGPETFLVVGGGTVEYEPNNSTGKTVAFGTIRMEGENRTVPIISTDLSEYLRRNDMVLEGDIPRKDGAIVGNFLAGMWGVRTGDRLSVRVGGKQLDLEITGRVRSKTQASTSILVRENFRFGTGDERLELTTGRPGGGGENVLEGLRNSPSREVLSLGDVDGFIREVNRQALSLISVWVLIGYGVVLVGSGVGTARLVEESEEELETLRSVGAGRKRSFLLMFLAVSSIAFSGSLVGVSLGIVGSQIVTTAAGWVSGGGILTPILDLQSALEIFGLASASAIGGGLISLTYVMRGSEN